MRIKYLILLAAVVAVCGAVAETAKQLGKRPANVAITVQGAPASTKAPAAPPPAPEPEPRPQEVPANGQVELQVEEAASVETPATSGEEPVAPVPAPMSVVDVLMPKDSAPGEQAAPDEEAQPDLAQVMDELRQLRNDMLKLQQTVDILSNNVLEENRQLRQQLRQAYEGGAMAVPSVPTPERALIEKALHEPQPPAAGEKSTKAASDDADGDGFVVVAEWGRTPEDAKAMQPPKASLKGMIACVNAGTSDEKLAELGNKLHQEYNGYDNINIEVFDSEKAAYDFKRGQAAGDHRVLSISRHRESGRDVILIIRGEIVKEVPLQGDSKGAAN